MATKIDFRFLFDSEFFRDVLWNDFDLQQKLAYITSYSTGNKKKQNLISAKSRQLICEQYDAIDVMVRIFLNRIDEPEIIETVENEVERTLKYAVHLTSQWPFKVIVFTSKERIADYAANEHYSNIRSISFICGDDARELIEYWFRRCREERQSC